MVNYSNLISFKLDFVSQSFNFLTYSSDLNNYFKLIKPNNYLHWFDYSNFENYKLLTDIIIRIVLISFVLDIPYSY